MPDESSDLLIATLTDAFTGKPVSLGFLDLGKFTKAVGSLKGDPHARARVFSGLLRGAIREDAALRNVFLTIAKEVRP